MRHFLYGLFAGFILLNPALAPALTQDLPTDFEDSDVFEGTGGFDIEEDSGAAGGGWGRYIGGSVGAVTADGDVVSRQLTALRLDIDLPASDRLKTVLSIDAVDFENSYTRELREHLSDELPRCMGRFPDRDAVEAVPVAELTFDPGQPEPLTPAQVEMLDAYNLYQMRLICEPLLDETSDGYIPEEIETKISDNFVDFREAYVQWEPTDYATLSVGRQNLVWGQFDFLSPVGFLLPFRNTNTSMRPSRADFSYAQDAVNLALFPTGNSEVQLIHVPAMRLDPQVEESLKQYVRNDYCQRDSAGDFTASCLIDADKNFFPDIADYDMSALRFTHYGQRLTFSITALDGVLSNFGEPYRDATLFNDGRSGVDCGTHRNDGDEEIDTPYCWRNDRGLAYAELDTLALEFSYIWSPRVTVKGEYVAYESVDSIDFRSFTDLSSRERSLAAAIREHNQGKPYITTDENFLALGFEYEGDEWFGHLQVVVLDSEPSGEVDKLLECIDDGGEHISGTLECRPGQFDNEDDDSDAFPVFFIGRRLGADDDGFVGGGATAFFNAYGLGIFGGWQLNEDIEIGGFIGSVIDVADSGPPSDEFYDSIDDGDALAQIGVTYLF